jgi:hypothetical protein
MSARIQLGENSGNMAQAADQEMAASISLLQAELERDRQMHRHSFAIERCRPIFPLFQSIQSCLMEQRRAGDDFHCGNTARSVDKRINGDVSRDMLILRQYRIDGLHGRDEFGLFHLSADGQRSRWCSWLVIADN